MQSALTSVLSAYPNLYKVGNSGNCLLLVFLIRRTFGPTRRYSGNNVLFEAFETACQNPHEFVFTVVTANPIHSTLVMCSCFECLKLKYHETIGGKQRPLSGLVKQ